jgi:transposase
MPQPLSNDLRLRLVEFVEEGHSRREAALRFKMTVSCAVECREVVEGHRQR